jgi:peptide/nickel transport system permease protein
MSTASSAPRELTGRRPHVPPLVRFVLRRLGAGVVTLFFVSIFIFAATELLPGNVATAVLGREATPQAVQTITKQLHLNEPAYQRYEHWLTGLLQGNLGQSIAAQAVGNSTSVASLTGQRFINSTILALLTLAFFVPIGLAVGVFCGTRPGSKIDHWISLGTVAVISLPEFVTGTVLIIIFAQYLGILPTASFVLPGQSVLSTPSILVLPVLTLLAASLAQMIRMVRAGVVDALNTPYSEMAVLDGIPPFRVTTTYALRNSIAPVIQVVALNLQWLVGGIVVTETLFDYPGIGQELVQAVNLRDIPTVQSVGIIIAAVYITTNIVADLLVVFAIPKLRTSAS